MAQTRRNFIRTCGIGMAGLVCAGGRSWAAAVTPPTDPPTLDFLGRDINLMRRSEWTHRAPRPWRLRAAGQFDRLTIHHAGNGVVTETDLNAVMHRLDGVLTAHMDRNYGDIGYHFVVDYAGRVWEGRSLAYEGAHVSCQNERNIGIMMFGNFDKQRPSPVQLNACEELVECLRMEYRIKRHRIYGHRDLGQSACPGDNLYTRVVQLRS